jgi:hypothetical protein
MEYSDTNFGKMWIDPSAPYKVQQTPLTVVSFNSATEVGGILTSDSIFKYYSTDSQVDTQYIHLNFVLQSGATGSDWTTVKSFAREIGKDTLPAYNAVRASGVEGTFTFPVVTGHTYQRVVMNTFGSDSTGYFKMVVGLSNDHFYRDTPTSNV